MLEAGVLALVEGSNVGREGLCDPLGMEAREEMETIAGFLLQSWG